MCGIFGYVGDKENAGEVTLEGLKILEYRGYDSWGIAVASNEIIEVIKDVGKIGELVKIFPKSTFALGHTRWATHGNVTKENAHPHLDCDGKIALIHNGIIENYETLKNKLLQKGHNFKSQTDTEVAVHLIEDLLKNGNTFLDSVRLAFNSFHGLNAIIVMDTVTKSFVAAKNGSPLVIGKGQNANFIASDAPALVKHTKNVHFMEDNEIIEISDKTVQAYYAENGRPKSLDWEIISWKYADIDKGKFKHFMLKEIFEQPKVIQNILESSKEPIKDLAALIRNSYGTYLVACGTAAYAALTGTYLFSKIAKRHVNFAVGSEFGYQLDFLKKKSLIIALSQSGETIDTLDAVKKAKQKGATIVSLVNVLGSSLYRMADEKILLLAGPEKAVASTKAFTAKLAYLILLAYTLNDKFDDGKSQLFKCAAAVETILKDEIITIEDIAKKISKAEHIFVIGRGIAYPLALETALKIKEVSYIHAEGMASGELKHGPIALVESGTPVIAFLPNDETYGANLVGAMEMKARGAHIVGISYKRQEIFDDFIKVEDCKEASSIPLIVCAQLLAYYLAIERGVDPDKPRNLAKSVTVK